MRTLVVDQPRETAKAFDETDGIKAYHDRGDTTVGETGRRTFSAGELVTVEILESETNNEKTKIAVQSEKAEQFNITANPHRYESRFMEALTELRDQPIDSSIGGVKEATEGEQVGISPEEHAIRVLIIMSVIILTLFFLFIAAVVIFDILVASLA